MKTGDMVKMKQGYSKPGIILMMLPHWPNLAGDRDLGTWVRVLWPDHGPGLEKERDLEALSD